MIIISCRCIVYLWILEITHISHDCNSSFYLIQRSICRLILTIFYRWVNISHRPLVDLMCFNGLFYVYFKRLWIFFFPLSSSKCTTGLKGIIRVHHRSQKREVYRRCENWHMDFHLFLWHKQTGLYHKKCLVSLPRYLSAQFRSINNYSKNIWSWLKLYVNCKGLNIYENVMRLYVNVVWTLIRTKSLSLPRFLV